MGVRVSESTASAYRYPLLLKHLLHMPLATARDQEIVHRDRHRCTYATFDTCIRRLANLLTRLGVEAGTTVAVMDWDSHRYLESYFAIPMLGAILQTVNIRLATAQIGYTLQDSAAIVLLINRDFLPILRAVQRQPTLRTLVLLDDEVADVAVVAVADEHWGERPAALIVLRAEFAGTLQPEAIGRHLQRFVDQGSIPSYAIPQQVHFRAGTGKNQRRQTR